ncbi:MAG: GspH/FimT family pseudopilin [Gammaproteobacteria bacterium]|nr:GspH/FimT family pseudopilin [Gammaproteobacteria bacterium]NNF60017.1 prepilin-type N-terminal cleavage/methylation domain-containing protein [Gammaproteobacteria bacterium]NNM20079.1 prepilin-type N-terminal cleavage/methylation domain-containing protein [Gammaproteobacteria bacterium]
MQPCGALRAGTAGPEAAAPQAGFTLVELVVVLAVIGLLAVVAAPRFFGNSVFEERAYRDEVVSALRYARNLAVGSGCPVRVRLNAASYDLSQQAVSAGHCNSADASWPVSVLLPDGQPVSGTAPPGITAAPELTIVFDAAGRTSLGADQVITIGSGYFTLRAGSGYVSP